MPRRRWHAREDATVHLGTPETKERIHLARTMLSSHHSNMRTPNGRRTDRATGRSNRRIDAAVYCQSSAAAPATGAAAANHAKLNPAMSVHEITNLGQESRLVTFRLRHEMRYDLFNSLTS